MPDNLAPKTELPRIYPITDRRATGLSHLEQVRRLAAGGASFIQLREKYGSPGDFYEEARAVIAFAREAGIRIIINDRVDIAVALGADGVHLGQDDLPPTHARRILGDRPIIGFSTHSVAQATAASEMPVDYIAVGPVYDTQTKENPDQVVGLEGVRQVRCAVGDIPLVAIGGIEFENFRSVLDAGADSVAVIRGLLSPPECITSNTRRFLHK